MASPNTNMADVFARFHESGAFADATVLCKGRPWKVHKLVMATKSDYFLKAFDGHFRESKQAMVELTDDDPNAVAAMIHYCYHNDYDEKALSGTALMTPSFHLKVYTVGDKYMIKGLCELAQVKFATATKAVKWDSKEFSDLIREGYASTRGSRDEEPNKIRQELLLKTLTNATKLFSQDPKFAKFQDVAESVPEYMADLMRMAFSTGAAGIPAYTLSIAQSEQDNPDVLYLKCQRCSVRFPAARLLDPGGILGRTGEYTHPCGVARRGGNAKNCMSFEAWMRRLSPNSAQSTRGN